MKFCHIIKLRAQNFNNSWFLINKKKNLKLLTSKICKRKKSQKSKENKEFCIILSKGKNLAGIVDEGYIL